MLNRYPILKCIALIFILIIVLLYLLPNFFCSDPALQITNKNIHNNIIDNSNLYQISNFLEQNNITIKAITLDHGIIVSRFNNIEEQLRAHSLLIKFFDL